MGKLYAGLDQRLTEFIVAWPAFFHAAVPSVHASGTPATAFTGIVRLNLLYPPGAAGEAKLSCSAGNAWLEDDRGPDLPVTTRPLQSNLELGAFPSAAPCARLHAKHVAWEWGLGALGETVELVVSELVTNAIKAAVAHHDPDKVPDIPYVWVRLTGGQDQMLVEVWDSSPEPPVRAQTGRVTERGRGLLLVEAVSVSWGYYNVAAQPSRSEPATAIDQGAGEYAATRSDRTTGPQAAVGNSAAATGGKVVWALCASQ